MAIDLSVVICTNRSPTQIERTLASLFRARIPCGLVAEVLIVNNGTESHSELSVSENALSIRFVSEPIHGLSNARNRGIRESSGNALLFTDDDILVPEDWIETMALPILDGSSDAVSGQVRIADALRRPWLDPFHFAFFAEILGGPKTKYQDLVGASMAIGRHVFDQVPAFDTDLGAGALGFGEETLFCRQMLGQGFRLCLAGGNPCVHEFNPDRLFSTAMIREAALKGKAHAYIDHHWDHRAAKRLGIKYLRYTFALATSAEYQAARLDCTREGCSSKILQLVKKKSKMAYHWAIRDNPRKYEMLDRARKQEATPAPF